MAAAELQSPGKTAALEQLSTDEQAVVFEPSPLSQPLQSLCPEAPESDAIAIWTLISPACTADRLMPRPKTTPRKSARNRCADQCFMAVNMAAMPPHSKEDGSHIVAMACG